MSSHTPGPWTAVKDTEDKMPWSVFAQDANEGRKLPALVDIEDNARLIAAAPDLLAALSTAVKWLNDLPTYWQPDESMQPLTDALVKATINPTPEDDIDWNGCLNKEVSP